MSQFSILYGLSGSEASKQAAELAWKVAELSCGRVDAHHVIDSRAVWELLRNDKPGFIGSGPYVAAYDELTKQLRSIADKLCQKYEACTEEKAIAGQIFIEEGNPIELISKKSKNYDLVVVGHQSRDAMGTGARRHYVRFAVAEGLAHECPTALLVLQGEVEEWKSLTVLVSVDHLNYKFIEACIKFAGLMKIAPKVVALDSGVNEMPADKFAADLKKALPDLADISVERFDVSGMTVEQRAGLWQHEEIELDWAPDADTLLVLPTRRSGSERLTVFDTAPDLFVRNLTLPSILMWPEEHIDLSIDNPKQMEATR